LKITAFEVHLGDPAYSVVGTDGVLEPIEVHLTTKNQSNGTACPSITAVFFQDSARHQFVKRIQIPELKAGKRSDRTVEITGTKPALGFAQLGAHADNGRANKESDESNNLFHGRHFAIIAKEWDAKSFDVATRRAWLAFTGTSRIRRSRSRRSPPAPRAALRPTAHADVRSSPRLP
jgi:hypothetical protein